MKEPVVLAIGIIYRYKNIESVIRAQFSMVSSHTEKNLNNYSVTVCAEKYWTSKENPQRWIEFASDVSPLLTLKINPLPEDDEMHLEELTHRLRNELDFRLYWRNS